MGTLQDRGPGGFDRSDGDVMSVTEKLNCHTRLDEVKFAHLKLVPVCISLQYRKSTDANLVSQMSRLQVSQSHTQGGQEFGNHEDMVAKQRVSQSKLASWLYLLWRTSRTDPNGNYCLPSRESSNSADWQ